MSEALSSIRNIGPAMEAAFKNAGIENADALRDLGADEGYRRLLASGHRPHFIAYYVIVMGLQDWVLWKEKRQRDDPLPFALNRSARD